MLLYFQKKMKRGSQVSVNMTDLKRWKCWEDYRGCWLSGKVDKVGSKRVTVTLDGFEDTKLRRVDVEQDRVQPLRGATEGHKWSKGDKVHVREENGGIEGWWEATIQARPSAKKCRVQWTYDYDVHGNTSMVDASNIRLAQQQHEEEEELPLPPSPPVTPPLQVDDIVSQGDRKGTVISIKQDMAFVQWDGNSDAAQRVPLADLRRSE